MSFYCDVDCGICVNLDSWKCQECEHLEREDYYEASPELLARCQEEKLKKQFEAIPKDSISVSFSKELMKAFVIAKKYTTTIPKYWCVYCANDYLLATDCYRMIKIDTDVPSEIRGKHIIDIQAGKALIHLEPTNVYVNGSAINLYNKGNAQIITTKQKFRELLTNYKEYKGSSWVGKKFIIQDKYLEDILKLIPDDEELELTIKHGEQLEPVTFGFKNYEILVVPIRPHN